MLSGTSHEPSALSNRFDQLSIVNEYENDNVVTYRQSEYSNRSTLVAGEVQNNNQDAGLNYSNLPPMGITASTTRASNSVAKSTGAIKKIPENLKLRSDDKINNNNAEEVSMYRSSGPYIPLSDCFSGSPVLFVSFEKFLLRHQNFNFLNFLEERKRSKNPAELAGSEVLRHAALAHYQHWTQLNRRPAEFTETQQHPSAVDGGTEVREERCEEREFIADGLRGRIDGRGLDGAEGGWQEDPAVGQLDGERVGGDHRRAELHEDGGEPESDPAATQTYQLGAG